MRSHTKYSVRLAMAGLSAACMGKDPPAGSGTGGNGSGGATSAGGSNAGGSNAGGSATGGKPATGGAGGSSVVPPSRQSSGPGLSDCGGGGESCCTSLEVPGGTFYRTYTNDGSGAKDTADPATVSDFRLDKYLVTVDRFRGFVAAWDGGSRYKPEVGFAAMAAWQPHQIRPSP